MQRLNLVFRNMFMGIMVAFLLGVCAFTDRISDYFFGEDEELSPPELMAEGMERMENGNYKDAVEAFQNIKDRYPYSKYAITAEMKVADALFMTEEFDEALDAYDEFERLHPKNENIPYVIYRKGMCHFRQITTIDREQSHTLKAK